MELKFCPDVCSLAKWVDDPAFDGRGQHNCPYHFGVTHSVAIKDGAIKCKHFKAKKVVG